MVGQSIRPYVRQTCADCFSFAFGSVVYYHYYFFFGQSNAPLNQSISPRNFLLKSDACNIRPIDVDVVNVKKHTGLIQK